MKMAEQIVKWIEVDQRYGYTPEYHDENYLNRYCAEHEPDVILPPEYCMPETMIERGSYGLINMKPKIIAITKQNVIR
jgi:hypothetical protein